MKIYVDFSIHTATGSAVGRVSGYLDFAAIPQINNVVVLAKPIRETPFPKVDGFTGHMRVQEVRFEPSSTDAATSLTLDDLIVPSSTDADSLFRYFEQGFGLSADSY